jgi:uncharacterized protein YgbK (DUF1537 family)
VTAVDAMQTTLAAEHAAVYVFGVLGGRAAALQTPALRAGLATAYDTHLARRDQLRVRLTELGADPVAAEAAYALPRDLTTAAQLAVQALSVERSCVTTYAAQVAATVGHDRSWAIDALIAGAGSELGFGGAPQPLPGARPVHRLGG